MPMPLQVPKLFHFAATHFLNFPFVPFKCFKMKLAADFSELRLNYFLTAFLLSLKFLRFVRKVVISFSFRIFFSLAVSCFFIQVLQEFDLISIKGFENLI